MSQELRDAITSNPDNVDLIEAGGYQAARATSQERVNRIVEAGLRGICVSVWPKAKLSYISRLRLTR